MSLAKRHRAVPLVLLIALLLIAAGCGAGNDTKEQEARPSGGASAGTDAGAKETERTLTDAVGHEVKVPARPQRIIAPFLEDSLTALGVKPVAQWSAAGVPQQYLQDKLQGVPALDMTGGLKPEETLGYSPDLIVLLAPTYLKSSYESFSKIAPTFVLSNDENDWRGNLIKLGDVLGKNAEAQKALQDYDRKLAEAKEKVRATVGDKTAVLYQSAEEKGFKLFGSNFYSGALLYQSLGFKQPKLLKGDYDTYSLETLPALSDVDYLFVLSGKGRAKPPTDNPLWQQLPAVKQGRVFDADSGHWFNQNIIANGLVIDDVLRSIAK